ncbi:TPA: zinc ribbon domain-containing protein [Yersinia enterocolitica]
MRKISKSEWCGLQGYLQEPSSKLCCSCGEFNAELTLAMRTWTCPSCGSGFH